MTQVLIEAEPLRRSIRIFTIFRPAISLVADLFFDRLLIEAPDARNLLPAEHELDRQFQLFLSIVMSALLQNEYNPAIFARLGAMHQQNGITHSHYQAAKRSFLWVIKEGLDGILEQKDLDALAMISDLIITKLILGHEKNPSLTLIKA